MIAAAGSISGRLREATQQLHDLAEQHPFQKALAGGTISRTAYVDFLNQMLFLHQALEQSLVDLQNRALFPSELTDPKRYKARHLRTDLSFFGESATHVEALASARSLAETLSTSLDEQPERVIGAWYVLEGSTNGSKFIARSLLRSLQLTNGAGTAFLDPYGDEQRSEWMRFKQGLDQMELSESELDNLVAGACEMFKGITALSEELFARHFDKSALVAS